MNWKILVIAIAIILILVLIVIQPLTSSAWPQVDYAAEAQAVSKICESETHPVEVKTCGENYFTGWVPVDESGEILTRAVIVDSDTKYYDAQGNFIISCGGYRIFNAAHEKECSKYNCTDKIIRLIKEIC